MTKNYLKNAFLIGSGICLATSFAIYAQPAQLGTSIQANLVNLVQYLGELHITSDGTPNGNEVLSINSNGEFSQTREDSSILNTSHGFNGYPFAGAIASSGDFSTVAGVFGTNVGMLAKQNNTSGQASYFLVNSDRSVMGFNADTSNQTNQVSEIQVLDYGIVFTFPGASYLFPINQGNSGQVLTTNGAGELNWTDVSGGGSTEVVLTTHKTISSAEMLDLANNPITLIDAPGVGQFIDVVSVAMRLSNVTTAYDFSVMPTGGPALKYSTASNNLGVMQSFFYNSATDSFIKHSVAGSAPGGVLAPEDALILTAGSTPTQGDGTLDVYITYRIVDL